MTRTAALCAACLAACLLPGCASSGNTESQTESWGARRQREWDQLTRLKGELRWRYDEPVTFSFPGNGDVIVRHWWLEGGPGWEYVRAKFTYHNTTDKPMGRVYVKLSVLDGEGRRVVASKLRLRHPWGLPLAPGTYFSDEISVPTDGEHLDPKGWHWSIECKATPEAAIEEAWGASSG